MLDSTTSSMDMIAKDAWQGIRLTCDAAANIDESVLFELVLYITNNNFPLPKNDRNHTGVYDTTLQNRKHI